MEEKIIEQLIEQTIDAFCILFKSKKFLCWSIIDTSKLKIELKLILSEFMTELVKLNLSIYNHDEMFPVLCKKSPQHFTSTIDGLNEEGHYEKQFDIWNLGIIKIGKLIYPYGIAKYQGQKIDHDIHGEIENELRIQLGYMPFIIASILREKKN